MTDLKLTEKDQALLELLRENARISVSELARRLQVSRTTAQQRLSRLEGSGIITGYSIRLSESSEQHCIKAWISVETLPKLSRQVCAQVAKYPQVRTLHTVSGKFDLVIWVVCQSPKELDNLLDDFGDLEGVKRTESAIVLTTKFER